MWTGRRTRGAPDGLRGRRSGRRGWTALATVMVAAAVVVAGCSDSGGGNDSGGASSAEPGAGTVQPDGGSDARDQAAPGATSEGGSSRGSSQVPALDADASGDEMLARRAHITLEVDSIQPAVDRVHAVNDGVDGLLLSESLGSDDPGDPVPLPEPSEDTPNRTPATYAELVISVPSDTLDDVLGQLGRIGEVLDRSQSAENVHDQYVDTTSRLKTMRVSVNRVRDLMDQAENLTQVVRLESELAQREADLEALESRLAALEGSVSRAPVRVSLTTQPETVDERRAGFLGGLATGWDAFLTSGVVLATLVGLLVPFAALAAVVSIPLLWWWRRHRRPGAVSA
jgi:hypothetical protein